MKRIGQRIQTVRVTGIVCQPAQQQTEHAQFFVKRRVPQFGSANRLPGAGKQLIHAVNLLVFVIKLQIIRKIACHLRQLQILLHNLTINRIPSDSYTCISSDKSSQPRAVTNCSPSAVASTR